MNGEPHTPTRSPHLSHAAKKRLIETPSSDLDKSLFQLSARSARQPRTLHFIDQPCKRKRRQDRIAPHLMSKFCYIWCARLRVRAQRIRRKVLAVSGAPAPQTQSHPASRLLQQTRTRRATGVVPCARTRASRAAQFSPAARGPRERSRAARSARRSPPQPAAPRCH